MPVSYTHLDVYKRQDAGLAFGNRGEGDAGGHHSGIEEGAGEVHGKAAVADEDRRDGRLAGWRGDSTDIEAEAAEFLLEVAGVFPEPLDAFGLVFENIEGADTAVSYTHLDVYKRQEE